MPVVFKIDSHLLVDSSLKNLTRYPMYFREAYTHILNSCTTLIYYTASKKGPVSVQCECSIYFFSFAFVHPISAVINWIPSSFIRRVCHVTSFDHVWFISRRPFILKSDLWQKIYSCLYIYFCPFCNSGVIVHVDVTNISLTCMLLTLSYGNTYGSILVTYNSFQQTIKALLLKYHIC